MDILANVVLWLIVAGSAVGGYAFAKSTFKKGEKNGFIADHLRGIGMGTTVGVVAVLVLEMSQVTGLPAISEDAPLEQIRSHAKDDQRSRHRADISVIIVCAVFGMYGARSATGRRAK